MSEDTSVVAKNIDTRRQRRKTLYKFENVDKVISKIWNLNTRKERHSQESAFACDVCGEKVTEASHICNREEIYRDAKPFRCECEVCENRYVYSVYDYERIHASEVPLKCEICQLYFTTLSQLNAHKATHTRVQPYRCECDACENNRFAFSVRERIPTVTLRPNECEGCHRSFSSSSPLHAHKLIHTGETTVKSGYCDK